MSTLSSRIPPLTPQTASKLQNCIDQLTALVEKGINPTAALEKVADDNNLLPEQIRLVGRAYNIGLSNYNLHELRNLAALHNNVLADIDSVVTKLYPTTTKKEASDNTISSWYSYSPEEHIKKARGIGQQIQNIVRAETELSADSKEREMMRLYRKELLKYAHLKQQLQELAEEIQCKTAELIDFFKSSRAVHPEEVLENCAIMDHRAAKVMELLLHTEELKKYASVVAYNAEIPFDWRIPPYSILRRLVDCLEDYTELKGITKEAQDKLNRIRDTYGLPDLTCELIETEPPADDGPYRTEIFLYGGFRTPFFRKTAAKGGGKRFINRPKTVSSNPSTSGSNVGGGKQSTSGSSIGGGKQSTSGSSIGGGSPPPSGPNTGGGKPQSSGQQNKTDDEDDKDIISRLAPQLSDAASRLIRPLAGSKPTRILAEELSSIFQPPQARVTPQKLQLDPEILKANANTVKVLLIDLMLNDPIISNYEPEKVYQAYAKLIQIAPTAATKSEIMRILLRKMLTMDTLEPKDVVDLLALENALNK